MIKRNKELELEALNEMQNEEQASKNPNFKE